MTIDEVASWMLIWPLFLSLSPSTLSPLSLPFWSALLFLLLRSLLLPLFWQEQTAQLEGLCKARRGTRVFYYTASNQVVCYVHCCSSPDSYRAFCMQAQSLCSSSQSRCILLGRHIGKESFFYIDRSSSGHQKSEANLQQFRSLWSASV